ncbi:MAG: signal peptidase I [Accumulibacter sp.]|jgi:conjugal transfer pilin signal peptidase TrbI|uniref:signal peptidase I n=1 Tax=Accumulibacter sp. TaxID=2053492 RepID=UPI002FC290DD
MPIRRLNLRGLELPLILWIVAAHLSFGRAYLVAFNLTASLPGTLFLIQKGTLPNRGDLVAFRWLAHWPYPQGSLFVKRLIGMPGSIVSARDRDFFVDGYPVGRAKERARTGESLEIGAVGTIPEAHYYVAGEHPDSLDSRYRLTGWVARQQIVGRAHRIF